MVASLSNPADIVNASLVRIGWKSLVGNLYDGSAAARAALATYGQTRDDLLRSSDWGFAERNAALVVIKIAPTNYIPPNSWDDSYPPVPWRFEYAYPADCLQVRSLRPRPLFVGPNFDPTPIEFKINNDRSEEARTILTDLQDALVVYTGRILDPSTFSVDFTEVLIEKLGANLAPTLTGLNPAQMQAVEADRDTAQAEREQG